MSGYISVVNAAAFTAASFSPEGCVSETPSPEAWRLFPAHQFYPAGGPKPTPETETEIQTVIFCPEAFEYMEFISLENLNLGFWTYQNWRGWRVREIDPAWKTRWWRVFFFCNERSKWGGGRGLLVSNRIKTHAELGGGINELGLGNGITMVIFL